MRLFMDSLLEREKRLLKAPSAYSGGVVGSLTGPLRLTRFILVERRSKSWVLAPICKLRSCNSRSRNCSSALRFAVWMSSYICLFFAC